MKLAINVRPYTAKGSSVKGFADVTVNDTMTIHGVQVIEGEKGLFVAMPQTSKPKEENSEEKVYSDLVFPTNAATRGFLSESILDVYFPEGVTFNTYTNKDLPNQEIKVRVTPYTKEGRNIRAMASATIGDFHINNITILKGNNNLFVSYPSKAYEKNGQKQYQEIIELAPPIRQMVNGMLLNEYKHVIDQAIQKQLEEREAAEPKDPIPQKEKKTPAPVMDSTQKKKIKTPTPAMEPEVEMER